MKLRNLLFLLVIALPVTVAAKPLKIATIAPDGTAWMKEMRAAAKTIAENTDGRVEIKYFPGGVMGNDNAVLRKIRIGQLQGGAFTGGSIASVYNDAQIYTLPFMIRDYAEIDYLRAKMDPLIEAGMRKNGMTSIGISEGGFAYMFSRKPVRAVEDLSGSKVWISEGDRVAQVAFERAGLAPVALPIPDVYTALQTGLLDTVTTPPTGAIAFQWHTKLNYMTTTPLTYLIGVLVIDNRAFDRIAPADQAVVKKIMAAAFRRLDEINRRDNIGAQAALKSQGITFVEPGEQELVRWQEVAADAITQLGNEGVYSPQMLEIMRGHLQDFRSRSLSAAK